MGRAPLVLPVVHGTVELFGVVVGAPNRLSTAATAGASGVGSYGFDCDPRRREVW
jgi:hypothetical protein